MMSEMVLKFIEQFALSFISAVGFAIIWQVPKSGWVYAGLCGTGGWLVYWAANLLELGPALSNFLGSLTIAAISYYLARWRRTPATLYNIPGITSLVPGGTSYKMTYSLITGQYTKAVEYGLSVMVVAGAIAGGLIIFEIARRNLRTKIFPIAKRKRPF
ncbi:threonine/serine exporter family protein [Vagococcus intermedius]|uniref:Threonine/serine exporter family protein n=2 Tax=Vagococcus intermedius TaxID=2991418 RepID=A0AAF0CU17_9ENTE|nr:threonine/serine exporter family protein [Vagococcus intermedius]WEG72829.1 threonine/serine exporter family protein [Vagococcus intermedius]